jgi:hypothetical protein
MGNQTSKGQKHEPSGSFVLVGGHPPTSINSDSRQAAAHSARAKKTAARIIAAKAMAEARERHQAKKDAKRMAKKQDKEGRIYEAENEAQELRRGRDAAEKEWTERRAREKQEEREAREERKRQDERILLERKGEKRRKMHLEGIAWGFDDRAGIRSGGSSHEIEGCYVSDGNVRDSDEADAGNPEEVDEIGRKTGRRWHRGNTWGVEAGGPGPEVVFEIGTPVVSRGSKKPGGWKVAGKE